MKKRGLEIFIVMVLFCVLAVFVAAPIVVPTEVAHVITPNDVMKSVVHIRATVEYDDWEMECVDLNTNFDGWQGSGVYVGNGLILTAGHVVEDANHFEVTFEDGCVYESIITYGEELSDVGFIRIEDANGIDYTPVVFDTRELSRGEDVWILGSPYGTDFLFTLTKGIISNVTITCDGFFGEKPIFMTDAASYPGNSGGPVVDVDGEIIGILVGGYGYADNLSICVRADVCYQAMQVYLEMLEMENL